MNVPLSTENWGSQHLINFVNSFTEDLGVSGKIGEVPILDISNLQQDFDKIMEMYSNDSILNSTSPIFTEDQANAYLDALDDLYSNISKSTNQSLSSNQKGILLEYIEHKFLFVVHQNDIVEDIIEQSNIIKGLGDEVKYGDSGDSGEFKKAVDELHNLKIINEEVFDEIEGGWMGGQENVASVKDYLNRSGFSDKFLGVNIGVDEDKISHKFEVPELTSPAPTVPEPVAPEIEEDASTPESGSEVLSDQEERDQRERDLESI